MSPARALWQANEQRRCAGFSSTELDSFRMKFTELDPTGSGVLDIKHLGSLFEGLGLPALATAEERDLLLVDLEKARVTASNLGVLDVGEKGFLRPKLTASVRASCLGLTDTLVSLIRSLGGQINDDQRKRLMRWMVTVDFGGFKG
eukprot:Skav225268  [mRNA]  locus=scaffold4099:108292:111577:+ [translate_table: standard]